MFYQNDDNLKQNLRHKKFWNMEKYVFQDVMTIENVLLNYLGQQNDIIDENY